MLESEFVGFGGVAPVMIHLGERAETHVISGVGVWPKAANVEHFHRNFGGRIPEGLLHTVVPAAPSIWVTALARFGTMSFAEVAAAAIRFARDGFPTYPFLAEQLAARQNDFSQWPSTAAVFLPGGRPPEVGEIFVQSDLGRTLQYMADEERAHANGDRLAGLKAARDAFYRGDIARAMLRHQAENGGWLTEDDLAGFRSPIEPACRISFGGFDVYGCGPWSQGPMVLEALNILGGHGPAWRGAQFGRLHPRGDRGVEARRGRSRGLFRRSGLRRCAARCAFVGRLRGATAHADRSGEGMARYAAGG